MIPFVEVKNKKEILAFNYAPVIDLDGLIKFRDLAAEFPKEYERMESKAKVIRESEIYYKPGINYFDLSRKKGIYCVRNKVNADEYWETLTNYYAKNPVTLDVLALALKEREKLILFKKMFNEEQSLDNNLEELKSQLGSLDYQTKLEKLKEINSDLYMLYESLNYISMAAISKNKFLVNDLEYHAEICKANNVESKAAKLLEYLDDARDNSKIVDFTCKILKKERHK